MLMQVSVWLKKKGGGEESVGVNDYAGLLASRKLISSRCNTV